MTTLEKIRAEVKNIVDFVAVNGGIYVREYDVVQIIDKYAEQEPKYCDRNICIKNEYNGIECDECIVNKAEQEPCDDVVSRQAVLKMAYDMSEIDGEHFTEPHMVVDVEDIQRLPSVTQKPIECDDAISRQAVIKLVRGCNSALEEPRIFNSHNSGVVFEQYIKELPPVRPQERKY